MNAKQIKSLRLSLGQSQQDFAFRLGLSSRSAVCHLERGSKEAKGPLLELLKLLAERRKQ